jgi:predicted dehydrogenase
MKPLTSALIGVGRIAQSLHLEAHKKVQGSVLGWVCDTNADAARSFAEQHNIPNWTDQLDQILSEPSIDWVDIAVPNRFHESVAIRSLFAGKHVLCQKPMADSAEAAQRMVVAAQESGRSLGMFMCFRGDTALRLVRRMIADGVLGNIISFRGKMLSGNGMNLREGQWRMDDASGALDLLGIHFIDLFAWMHSDIEWVQAYSNTLYAPMKGDDVTTAVYGLKAGVTAVLETTYCSYTYPGMSLYNMEINGTAGMVTYKLDTGELTLQLKNDFTSAEIACKGGELTQCKLEHTLKGGGAMANVHQAFIDSLSGGQPFDADGTAGFKALRVLEATRLAAKEKKQILIG